MPWYAWALVVFFVANIGATIMVVDKPRPKITPGTAAAITVFDILIILCVIELAVH